MTKLKKIELYLAEFPLAKERKNRYKTIRNLISKKYSLFDDITKQTTISYDKLEEIVFDSISFNRLIQRVQQLNPELRGTDYFDKKVEQEQQAQIDLEYTPGYQNDIKTLKNINDDFSM